MAQNIINDFLSKKEKTVALLKQSFLSQEAQQRYGAFFLDRLQAVGYQFEIGDFSPEYGEAKAIVVGISQHPKSDL